MLQNAYLLAKIGADTAKNELNFAEILPIGRRSASRAAARRGELQLLLPRRGHGLTRGALFYFFSLHLRSEKCTFEVQMRKK